MYTDGIIVSWDDARGFGFATTEKAPRDVFIHISDFDPSLYQPVVDQEISFLLSADKEGKLKGEAVRFRGKMLQRKRQSNIRKVGAFVPLVLASFAMFLVVMIQSEQLPVLVGYYYLLLSVISYFSYARDKRAATEGSWRLTEASLQLQSLLGGWPGAWFAQVHFRHKIKKRNFQWFFYLMILVNLAWLSWFFSDDGSVFIRSLAININFVLMDFVAFDFIQLWWWKLNYWLSSF